MTLRAKLTSFKSRILHFALPCILGTIASAQVPQVSIVTSFTDIVLPPQVTVVPVRYKVNSGVERTMDVPLTCTDTLCTGNVVVVDSLRGTGQQSFTILRTMDSLAVFPLNLLQDRFLVATRRGHSLFVRDGVVWAFGWNRDGQLGLGYIDAVFHPKAHRVLGLSRIASVYAGNEFSVALDSTGDVWTWGSNYRSALGNGETDQTETSPSSGRRYNSYYSRSFPQRIIQGKSIVSLSCGAQHCICSDTEGNVWVWGDNSRGALGMGSGSLAKYTKPTRNYNLAGIRKVYTTSERFVTDKSLSFSYAFRRDGSLYGMGADGYYCLAKTPNTEMLPQLISPDLSAFPGLRGPFDIRLSDMGTIIEYEDVQGRRVLFGYGYNFQSSLWDGGGWASQAKLYSIGVASDVAAGVWFSAQRRVGTSDSQFESSVFERGGGYGVYGVRGWHPIQKNDGSVFKARWISVGYSHGVAIDSAQGLWCWGERYACAGVESGVQNAVLVELDSSGSQVTHEIVIVTKFSDLRLPRWMKSISVEYVVNNERFRRDVLLNCDTSFCRGEISDLNHGVPLKKSFEILRANNDSGSVPLGLLQDKFFVATRHGHSLFVRNGEVWAFGRNENGQLGLGYSDTSFHRNAQKVLGLKRVMSVYSGEKFSVALDSSGDVWTWGSNYRSALGNGESDVNEFLPSDENGANYNKYYSRSRSERILSGQKIVSISCGAHHCICSDAFGIVRGWGDNYRGVLGMGANSLRKYVVPTINPNLVGIKKVFTTSERFVTNKSLSFAYALGWDGSLYGMGVDGYYCLANTPNTESSPQRVYPDLSDFAELKGPIDIRLGDMGALLEYEDLQGQRIVLAYGYNIQNSLWDGGGWSSKAHFYSVGAASEVSSGVWFSARNSGREKSGFSGTSPVAIRGGGYSLTGWRDVLRSDGRVLTARTISVGYSHGIALDSLQQPWCWGDAYSCFGSNEGSNTNAAIIDTLADSGGAILLAFSGDTIELPSSDSVVKIPAIVNGQTYMIPARILCQNNGTNCVADISIAIGDRVFGRRVFVVKKRQLEQDVEVWPKVIRPGGGVRIRVGGDLYGRFDLAFWKIDQIKPVFAGTKAIGMKSSSEINVDLNSEDLGFLPEGSYLVSLIYYGKAGADTVLPRYVSDRKSGALAGNDSWHDSCGFAVGSPLVMDSGNVVDAYCTPDGKDDDFGYIVAPGLLQERRKHGFPLSPIGFDSGAQIAGRGAGRYFWRSWAGGNFLRIDGIGIMKNVGIAADAIDALKSQVLSCSWEDGVDLSGVRVRIIGGATMIDTVTPGARAGRFLWALNAHVSEMYRVVVSKRVNGGVIEYSRLVTGGGGK